jgi:hypothetical protein
MDDTSETVWQQAKDLLQHHQKKDKGDQTPIDALNRLFHEAAPDAKSIRLSEMNCGIVSESWTTKMLAGLHRRHVRATPSVEGCSILVVRWQCNQYLIDGSNRVNKWVNESNASNHDVLVIVVVETAS